MGVECALYARSSSDLCADYAHDFDVRSVHKTAMDLEWFRQRKRELKLTDMEIGSAIGRDRSIANRLLSGAIAFDVKYAAGLASVFQADRATILHRAGITDAPAPRQGEAGPGDGRPDQPIAASVDGGETVALLRLDLSLPMGPGALVDDYVEDEPVQFDLGYLRAISRTPPMRLRLAKGVGDSMFPTLQSSDEVLIDTTQNQLLHADRIYAASINGGAAIKRLRPIEGGRRILVISDNKTIEPYPVDADEVRIWGRVIRFAREL